MKNYTCINKTEECKLCAGTNLCIKYENRLRQNPFFPQRKTVEEILDECLIKYNGRKKLKWITNKN